MSSKLFKQFIRKSILEKQQAPSSGPPRPGLVWKPETRRWIRPKTEEDRKLDPKYSPKETASGNAGKTKPSEGEWSNTAREAISDIKDVIFDQLKHSSPPTTKQEWESYIHDTYIDMSDQLGGLSYSDMTSLLPEFADHMMGQY